MGGARGIRGRWFFSQRNQVRLSPDNIWQISRESRAKKSFCGIILEPFSAGRGVFPAPGKGAADVGDSKTSQELQKKKEVGCYSRWERSNGEMMGG